MSFLRFAHPSLLAFLAGVPLLIGLRFYSHWRKHQALMRLGDEDLIRSLLDSVDQRRRRWKTALFLGGYILLVIAMAGPQVGTKIAYARRQGLDIFVALDVSLSMQAEDVAPNRLAKAKHEIRTLLQRLQGDRVGLIAFAGESFVQCPLTTDYRAVQMFLDILDAQTFPHQGTLLSEALRTALEAFQRQRDTDGRDPPPARVVLIVSDGEAHDPDREAITQRLAEQLAEAGVRVFAIGVGRPAPGSPIPLYDRSGQRIGYKKDRWGATVITRLEETTLQQLAQATGGRYYRATSSEREIDAFLDAIATLERRQLEERRYTAYEDRSVYFLLLAGLCLAGEWVLSDRRRSPIPEKGVISR